MWVSTGKAGTPKAWAITTEAVLWPTPGRASSAAKSCGNLAAVLLDEDFRQLGNGGGLSRGQAAGTDDRLDFLDRDAHHVVRIVGELEERGRDLVDADVGALGGQQDGDEQGVGVLVIERNRGLRIEFLKPVSDVIRALLLEHGASFRRRREIARLGRGLSLNPLELTAIGFILSSSSPAGAEVASQDKTQCQRGRALKSDGRGTGGS